MAQKQKLQRSQIPGLTIAVGSVQCIHTGGSQFKCLAYYTLRARGQGQAKFEAVVIANVDGRQVLWQAGKGTQI